jgi:hypothetical protein
MPQAIAPSTAITAHTAIRCGVHRPVVEGEVAVMSVLLRLPAPPASNLSPFPL